MYHWELDKIKHKQNIVLVQLQVESSKGSVINSCIGGGRHLGKGLKPYPLGGRGWKPQKILGNEYEFSSVVLEGINIFVYVNLREGEKPVKQEIFRVQILTLNNYRRFNV